MGSGRVLTCQVYGGYDGAVMELSTLSTLSQQDTEVARILSDEAHRQANTLTLIASENHIDRAVLEAQASILTDKYAEGYPGRRYYSGCVNVDRVEELAVERAKALFKADHANVQPHAGSQANMAAYLALVDYGDVVMGMDRGHGGHLTHGAQVNFSGKSYRSVSYGVARDTEMIDYEEVEKLAVKHRPRLIIAGASSYPRLIDYERFRAIADRVGAWLLVDMAHTSGIVAAGVHPSPVPYAHVTTGTTQKTLRGSRGGFILCHRDVASAVDAAVFPGTQGGPLMHEIAAKAVCFWQAMQPSFVEYQQAVLGNARTLASELQAAGLRLVSGGTDSHLVLVDLSSLGVSGRDMERALEAAGIQANRNSIPYDPRPPLITSGIRLGTPAITTRGFGAEEIRQLARLIVNVLSSPDDQRVVEDVKAQVLELCQRFPIPTMS